jgi:hypothetical protein
LCSGATASSAFIATPAPAFALCKRG